MGRKDGYRCASVVALAVTVDEDHCGVLHNPARDEHGTLDPAEVTVALVGLHEVATASDLADQLAA